MASLTNWFKKSITIIANFWEDDIVNKMLILVGVGLAAGVIFMAYTLIATAQGGLLYDSLFQKDSEIPTVVPVPITATHAPTPTTAFFPSVTALPGSGPSTTSGTDIPVTSTSANTVATFSASTTSIPFLLSSITPVSSSQSAPNCIPMNPVQTGRVLAVIDGNTIKVYTGGLVYFVRYIGIDVPKYGSVNDVYGEAAMNRNSKLVFGKDVSLIRDISDKDAVGHLLRYVMVGNTLVNLEMVRTGYATAVDTPPDSACAQVFKDAEQAARQAQVGRWAATPTPAGP